MDDQIKDVVIVGAGLVGSALAIGLNQQTDLDILVIDAGQPNIDESSIEPELRTVDDFDRRVSAINLGSQAFLESIGVWQGINQSAISPYSRMEVWDQKGTGKIEFDQQEVGVSHLGSLIENCAMLSSMHKKMSETTIEKQLANPIRSIKDSVEGYQLTLFDGRVINCRLLVGADGAMSWVKQRLSFGSREWDYGHKAIVATVEHERHHQHTAWQVFLDSGPLAFLPMAGKGSISSIVWSAEAQRADELLKLDDQTFSKVLGQNFEHTLGGIKHVSRRQSFPLRQRHAIEYVARHAVLVGDAAHTIHPLAGQGVNLGFHDVDVLVNELAAAANQGVDIFDPRILNRYQRKTQGKNLQMMAAMEGFKRLFGEDNMLVRLVRNTGMKWLNKQTTLKSAIIDQALY